MTTNGTTTTTDDEALAALFPEPVKFKAGRVEWELLPMDLATCTRFATKARPIIKQATEAMRPGGDDDTASRFVSAAILAASDHPEALLEALALATGKDAKTIGKLPPGVAFALIQTVLRINADFFAHAVGSLAFESKETPTAASNGIGPTH